MNKQAKAKLIVNAAIEFLANKHGVTVAQVEAACQAGNERVLRQLSQLCAAGIAA